MWAMIAVHMVMPWIFGEVVNALQEEALRAAALLVLGLSAVELFRTGIEHMSRQMREFVWNRNVAELKDQTNALFHEKTLGQHVESDTEYTYANVERGMDRVQQALDLLLTQGFVHIPGFLLSFVLLWTFGGTIGVLATCTVIVHLGWSAYLNYHVSVEMEPIERGHRTHNHQLVERIEKIVRVKTTGKSEDERRRLRGEHEQVLAQDLRFWLWFGRQDTYRDMVVSLLRMGVIGYGAYLVAIGSVSVGYLVPLYTWVRELGASLMSLGIIERELNGHMPYIRTLREVLSRPVPFRPDTGVEITSDHDLSLTFDRVHLSFGSVPVLQDVSLSVAPGEKVALIGPSGAGKSSMMKLALRYFDPSAGSIHVDGHDLRDVHLNSLLQHVGYIPQQAEVLDGTLRYNLTFGLSEEQLRTTTDEEMDKEIWTVMRQLHIDFGNRLTDGLDTRVGRNGIKLSGGEAQRLMIGAAVIKEPRFMIIDEATSSLDSTTERHVQEGLERALAGDTGALVIAHRLSTVRTMCDRFVVLRPIDEVSADASQIEAIADSFEALYAQSSTFRRLADDQHVPVAA
jgi:ABC-type multidrug transport system fused ATPase/permease subunit